MKQQSLIQAEGEIIQALPNMTFKVKLNEEVAAPTEAGSDQDNQASQDQEELAGREILCTLSGKMRLYRIRVIPGDKVKIELTSYDKNRGRIVYRLK